jgi:Glyoxalase-like domain
MELDHVLIAVTDLAAGARELEARHGLASIAGGRHRGWGTANRIVPLGDTYLELIAVVDPEEAATSPFGRWVAAGASEQGRPLGWSVRTTDLDAVTERLGLEAYPSSRESPGGGTLSWRVAGIGEAAAEPPLPFFLEWTSGTYPGRSAARQPASIARLALRGDPSRLAEWLGEHDMPVTVAPGAPGVAELVLRGPDGEFAIRG